MSDVESGSHFKGIDKDKSETITLNSLEKLKDFIGKTVIVEEGLFTFCTEEDHQHHYWSPHPNIRDQIKEVSMRLKEIDLEKLKILGVTEGDQDYEIAFVNQDRTEIGSYSLWVVTKIIYQGQPLFETKIAQDKRAGFDGNFYFRLEEYKTENLKS